MGVWNWIEPLNHQVGLKSKNCKMTKEEEEEVRIVFDLHFYSHADICENTIHIHITQL